MQIDRQRLLAAAARLDSDSSHSLDKSGSDSDSGAGKRRATDHKKRKGKHSKKSHSKSHKSHKRHKRSDHEKIAELERRAAAMETRGLLPSLNSRLGFGRHTSLSTSVPGEVVTLDTRGDANNTLYESLHSSDVPRFHRVDPMDLVHVGRRLASAQLRDAESGNTIADRYYSGKHYLQERNRAIKRVQLSITSRRPHQHGLLSGILPIAPILDPSSKSSQQAQCNRGSTGSTGATTSSLQPHHIGSSSSGAGSSRRLAMPAPAFIPLEAPQDMLDKAEAERDAAGSWQVLRGAGDGGRQKAWLPQELVEQAGLTTDELLMQASRTWNVAVRERPHDEDIWLDFAAFQHIAAQQQQQRSRSAAAGLLDPVTAEKQISVLTRGLTHHPSSSRLLLALLRAYAAVAPDADALEAKWAAVLARQGGSWHLWREYIALRQCSFAEFKVSGVQKAYCDALHSLQLELLAQRRRAAAAHKQQHKQALQLDPQQLHQLTPLGVAAATAASSSNSSSSSSGLCLPVSVGEEALELQLVQLLLGLMYSDLGAGYCEQTLAKMQALLEFHLFAPPLPPGGISALRRLFAAYWTAGVPRIGEEGARGWAYWCLWYSMGMEQPTPAAAAAQADAEQVTEQQQQQQEPVGWTGWFEAAPVPTSQQQQQQQEDEHHHPSKQHAPPSSQQIHEHAQATHSHEAAAAAEESIDTGRDAKAAGDEVSSAEEAGEDSEGLAVVSEDFEADEELDEEELMRQLGMQLEEQLQEVEREGLPADVLARWVQEEASCGAQQWQPLHTAASLTTDAEPDAPAPDPSRVAELRSVEECLFLLRSAAALRRLVLGCVELLGVPTGCVTWACSNSPTPLQQQEPLLAGPLNALQPTGSSSSSSSMRWSNAAPDEATCTQAAAAKVGQQQQQLLPWYAASDERWMWTVNCLQRLVAGGPCADWPELCHALLVLHASTPSLGASVATVAAAADGSRGGGGGGGCREATGLSKRPVECSKLQQLALDGASSVSGGSPPAAAGGGATAAVWGNQQQLQAARTAARQLLAEQQDNLLLYDAYGCLEAVAGQAKTARKVLETALSLATANLSSSSTGAHSQGDSGQVAQASTAAPLLALHLAQLELTTSSKQGPAKAHAALHALLAKQQLQAVAAADAVGSDQQSNRGLLSDVHLRTARVGFQSHIAELVAAGGGALTYAAAATIAAAALFELCVGWRQGRLAAGVDAAVAVCRQSTAAIPTPVRATSPHHEHLAVLQCHILVAAATGNAEALVPGLTAASHCTSMLDTPCATAAALAAAVPPSRAREVLAAALQLYPHCLPLLQLQVTLDQACHTLAGLRCQLAALTEVHSSPRLWVVALQAEYCRSGWRGRLGVLFERALAAPSVAQWQLQDRLQRQQQHQAWLEAARHHQKLGAGQQQQQKPLSTSEQREELLLQPASSAASAAALLDLAVWDGSRGCGQSSCLWQLYMQHELEVGRVDAARKLFLRAVHTSPGAKRLWLSGFGAVCSGLQPKECSGLLNVMQEREVMVRVDVYEVLLASMAEKQRLKGL